MVAVAAQAQAEAMSRKKKFVLYFATDFEEFRPLVTRVLSNITTPLFGLRSEEIGHIVYGRWRPASPCDCTLSTCPSSAPLKRTTALRSGGFLPRPTGSS
jgi:hypothetical protein